MNGPIVTARADRGNGDPRKNLNFVLRESAQQLRRVEHFDRGAILSGLRSVREIMAKDSQGRRDPQAEYNLAYLELYRRFDDNIEFRTTVERRTFDETRRMPDFGELSETYPDTKVPFLDQINIDHSHITPHQRFWKEHGYLLIENMIDASLCDEYINLRERLGLGLQRFPYFTPYVEHPCSGTCFARRRCTRSSWT